jgi:hypothetical protein
MRLPGEWLIIAGLGVAGIGLVTWLVVRSRKSPAERERIRRLEVHRDGRMGDGMILDTGEDTLVYRYSVRGVEYTATQDISAFRESLPEDIGSLVGPATVKYMPKNPFNSILICEHWAGFRKQEVRSTNQGAQE